MLLNYIDQGTGSPILLLHGIAGSARYWEQHIPLLAERHRVIAIDLLGFGRSPRPRTNYTYSIHIKSIRDTLKSAGVSAPMTLAGHSMGALLALKYAVAYPKEIKHLTLLNMPLYQSPAQAKIDITKSKKRLELTYYGPTSCFLCAAWCRTLRPLSGRLAHFYLPAFPRHVAEDSVLHTWQSYALSLHNIIENQTAVADISKLQIPTKFIYGDNESKIVRDNIKLVRGINKYAEIEILPGSHHLPIEKPETVAKLILKSAAE